MSDNNSSCDDSDSSDSSSSEDEQIQKPIFISKKQRIKQLTQEDQKLNEDRQKQILLSKLENNDSKSLTEVATDNADDLFDGIDDTDDLDPEQEYDAWKQRELMRFERDQKIIEQQELQKEEELRRSEMTEIEKVKEFQSRKKQQDDTKSNSNDNNHGYYHKGVFYNDEDKEDMANLLKRDYTEIANDNDNLKDHSRPTRLKLD
ncbi:uncharacterized protein J8A68_003711 [[Candida] subhashii]|uniref:Micro-fibrillar-associated protein 1 C-terminal domain-containing protein n=1 Tax=[Candida] subhashii TaxID=561895 RepID=A0A8J5QIQ4_9ASCO|nr:uncharacterized protein J8A68_003711 [[Candida] subhashii]KAG7662788.1 hypothetical protein J8A68_003711 [[Candida] subhashii]